MNWRTALLGNLIREERNRCSVPRTSGTTWHNMPTQQTDPVEHEQQESEQRQQNKGWEGGEGGGRRERERLWTAAMEGLIIPSESSCRQNITVSMVHFHVFIYPFSRSKFHQKQFTSKASTELSRWELITSSLSQGDHWTSWHLYTHPSGDTHSLKWICQHFQPNLYPSCL